MDENTHPTQADPKTSDTTSDRSSDSGAERRSPRSRLELAVNTLTEKYVAELESILNTSELPLVSGTVSMGHFPWCRKLFYQINLQVAIPGFPGHKQLECSGTADTTSLSSDSSSSASTPEAGRE